LCLGLYGITGLHP